MANEAAIQILNTRLNDLQAKLVRERTSRNRHKDSVIELKSEIADLEGAIVALNG